MAIPTSSVSTEDDVGAQDFEFRHTKNLLRHLLRVGKIIVIYVIPGIAAAYLGAWLIDTMITYFYYTPVNF